MSVRSIKTEKSCAHSRALHQRFPKEDVFSLLFTRRNIVNLYFLLNATQGGHNETKTAQNAMRVKESTTRSQ